MVTFVLGGGRSGKSAFAERLAVKEGQRTVYIATAVPFDEEMKRRVSAHQNRRPSNWKTIEMYHEFQLSPEERGIFSETQNILLDSLGMMVNNIMFDCGIGLEREKDDASAGEALAKGSAMKSVEALTNMCRSQGKNLILVSDEVGMGIVPETYLTRCYRDILGAVNQRAAELADRVYFMVAGIEMKIK